VNSEELMAKKKVAVVIPCYKVRNQILRVLEAIPEFISFIIVVDDNCPEGTADFVKESVVNPKLYLVKNKENLGVGGAVIEGYKKALALGADLIVKLDGDGQMDPMNIQKLVNPIFEGRADYTKGNRFFNVDKIGLMPLHRLFGNAGLSFFSKISSGYWSIFDPNNGFTAINSVALKTLPLDKIDKRYFFESDMLFRLNLARAVVKDVPMDAIYGDEISNLSAIKSSVEFTFKHNKNFGKRIFYSYFLREFSIASLNLIFGSTLFVFGFVYGLTSWLSSINSGIPTNTGGLVLISMTILSGLQMLLSFLSYDISHEPRSNVYS
jgi:glycosyltransferase involved in cell wall biosynthesis